MPRTIASIEARMGSSRFPGKVLADVCGRPALTRVLSRLRRCRRLDGIVLATSTAPADDELQHWSRDNNVPCYRGSEDDVLGRVVKAQRSMAANLVVEVTGDCVLLDPEIVDLGIGTFLANDCDVVSNTWKPSFPMGVDVQVFRLRDLEQVEATVSDPRVREHVSLHFYEHPDRYRIMHLLAPARWHGPDLRFQLDYPEDLRFITGVYSRLEPAHGDAFGVDEILSLLRHEPDLAEINRHCKEAVLR